VSFARHSPRRRAARPSDRRWAGSSHTSDHLGVFLDGGGDPLEFGATSPAPRPAGVIGLRRPDPETPKTHRSKRGRAGPPRAPRLLDARPSSRRRAPRCAPRREDLDSPFQGCAFTVTATPRELCGTEYSAPWKLTMHSESTRRVSEGADRRRWRERLQGLPAHAPDVRWGRAPVVVCTRLMRSSSTVETAACSAARLGYVQARMPAVLEIAERPLGLTFPLRLVRPRRIRLAAVVAAKSAKKGCSSRCGFGLSTASSDCRGPSLRNPTGTARSPNAATPSTAWELQAQHDNVQRARDHASRKRKKCTAADSGSNSSSPTLVLSQSNCASTRVRSRSARRPGAWPLPHDAALGPSLHPLVMAG